MAFGRVTQASARNVMELLAEGKQVTLSFTNDDGDIVDITLTQQSDFDIWVETEDPAAEYEYKHQSLQPYQVEEMVKEFFCDLGNSLQVWAG